MKEQKFPDSSVPYHQHIQSRGDLQTAQLQLVNAAQHELTVATPALDESSWNSSALTDALAHFLARHTRNRARIIIEDTEHLLTQVGRTVELARRYSDLLLIRRLGEPHRGLAEMFAVADRIHCLAQPDIRTVDATLDLGAPRVAAPWVQRFESIWEASEPIDGLHGFLL